MEFILAVLSYPPITRAFLIGLSVSLCAALIGVSLVLKRYSMIGDGLSHVAFGSLSIAFALNLAPLAVTVPVVMLAAFFLLRLSERGSIKGESAVALISSVSLAAGVSAASLSGVNMDVNSYMFGSILLTDKGDLFICLPLAGIVLLTFILFYHDIFLVTFDEEFAAASGARVSAYKTVLALMTALVIVVGMRIMGTLLISALIIFPALTAMRLFRSFRGVVLCAGAVSAAAFSLGLLCAYYVNLPAGAAIVLSNAVFFLIFFVLGKIKKVS